MPRTARCLFAFLVLLIPLTTQGSGSSIPAYTEVQAHYPQWYRQLVKDVKALHQRYQSGASISKDEIDRIFSTTIAPKSRMTSFIAWLVDRDACVKKKPTMRSTRCEAEYSFVFMAALDGSRVTGSAGTKKGWQGLGVYIDMGKAKWNPYRDNPVPKNGTLVRKQYPFLIFKKVNGKIVAWAVSTELTKVMEKLHFDVVRKR